MNINLHRQQQRLFATTPAVRDVAASHGVRPCCCRRRWSAPVLSVLELSSDTLRDAAAHEADDENNAHDAEHDRREVVLLWRRRHDRHVLANRLHRLSLTPTESKTVTPKHRFSSSQKWHFELPII